MATRAPLSSEIPISRKIRDLHVASLLIVLLAFFLPISTSALTIIGVLLLTICLAEGEFARKYRQIANSPVVMAILAFLMLYIIALLWTRDLYGGLEIIKKQWKYLLLPVLPAYVRREQIKYYLGAFVTAMSLSALASFLLFLDLIHTHHGSPADPTPFLDRIDYTPFLALTAFILADAAVHRLRGRYRPAAFALALLLSLDIFITQGRTGQIGFLALLVVWVFQVFPGRLLRAGLISLVCLGIISLGAYRFSPNFHARIDETARNFHNYDRKPDTSLGQRIIFLRNSWSVVEKHPWLGVGPGDFAEEYRLTNQHRSPAFPDTTDPHNQYLLVLAYFGPLGLLLLVRIFWRMAIFRPSPPDHLDRLRTGFLVFFLTIMCGGSYLNHFHAGFLFILGIALLFTDYPETAKSFKTTDRLQEIRLE